MARAESKAIMGYLPIEVHHHPAILSLIAPATSATRLLDPFAGEGVFLEAAAHAWNVTPYANELDGERAAACIERFGPKQAVRCDVERLMASNEAFGIVWANPPYDHDKTAKNSIRIKKIGNPLLRSGRGFLLALSGDRVGRNPITKRHRICP